MVENKTSPNLFTCLRLKKIANLTDLTKKKKFFRFFFSKFFLNYWFFFWLDVLIKDLLKKNPFFIKIVDNSFSLSKLFLRGLSNY